MGAAEEEKPFLPIRRPAEPGAKNAPKKETSDCDAGCVCACACWLVVLLAFLAAVFWLSPWIDQASKRPEYSVEIAAVSGLDPATDLSGRTAAALNPVFNLTVGIASTSTMYGACIDPGSSVKISYSYQLLPLASGMVKDVCVPPMGKSEQPVVARGVGVSVPGFLLDSLAQEMRRGEAVFQVKLITRHEEYLDSNMDTTYWTMVTCSGRVGAKASCYGRH